MDRAINRRKFLISLGKVGGYGLLYRPLNSFLGTIKGSFKLSLNPGAIGVQLSYEELFQAALTYQFDAIVPPLNEMNEWSINKTELEIERLRESKLSWGAAGLPVEFRKDEATFQEGLSSLKAQVVRFEAANVDRMSTWIMPTHATLDYEANMALHINRLSQVADVLKEHGIRLGLEYVGPKTLKESQRYPFVSNMSEAKQLISGINRTNVGLQLDAFHWYCAAETKQDLLSLSPDDIVTVDLNDAVAGRSRDEQLDWERELPGASGVIDLKAFLEGLNEIGYEGPMRAEPFNKSLNELDNQAALIQTSEAMHQAVQFLDN